VKVVERALDSVLTRGLIWNTQGSGKLWKSLMRVHLGDFEAVAICLPAINLQTPAKIESSVPVNG